MHNGIGLQTARGSGTSGHVQRNLAHRNKGRLDFKKMNRDAPPPKKRQADVDILMHKAKREIELKLVNQQEEWEKEGKYSDEEIKRKITDLDRIDGIMF